MAAQLCAFVRRVFIQQRAGVVVESAAAMARISARTGALVVLGFLAVRSINIRGIEKASQHGDTAAILGHVTIPMTIVLVMLVIIFWPGKSKG